MSTHKVPLTPAQTLELLRLVRETRENEDTCGECLMNLSEFAEKQLVGAQLNEALERVEHHLSLCPECAEEYQALKRVLEALR